MKYETSWRLHQDFNYAVQIGRVHAQWHPFTGDSYEEHCKKESAPWRFI